MEKMHLQFAVPYWLLWYLLDITFYRLLLPLFDKVPPRLRPLAVLAAVALALVCGYVPEFGYYLTTGRFFSFLPFFLAGYYLSRSGWFPHCLELALAEKMAFRPGRGARRPLVRCCGRASSPRRCSMALCPTPSPEGASDRRSGCCSPASPSAGFWRC